MMILMHPGEYIDTAYLQPMAMTATDLAARIGISADTVEAILAGEHGIDADLAIRLEVVLKRSAESWLSMQMDFDLARARSGFDSSSVAGCQS